jgi:RNA polymerase sigma-70 factor (ECF subfamily)
MLPALSRSRATELVEPHWRVLYNFVFRLTLDRDRTERYLVDIFETAAARCDEAGTSIGTHSTANDAPRAAPPGVLAWLVKIANQILEERLPRQPEVNFDILDDTLRNEATRTDVVRSLTDPQRDLLLWELKQGCMTAVLNCLPTGERAAFVACHVIKMPDEQAAYSLGISESAYKVRLSRARKKIGDYLAPRCEHVDPMNPCRCPARVGTALHKGFIRSVGPVGGEISLRKPNPYGRYGTGPGNDDAPMRDIAAIYRSLPEPDPPPELGARLVDKLVNQ